MWRLLLFAVGVLVVLWLMITAGDLVDLFVDLLDDEAGDE